MTGEGLGGLCRGGGWTYGALWRIDRRDPRLLVMEEFFHEKLSGRIFEKMINHVHVIGQGTVGEVAITGRHRWINFYAQCMESSEMRPNVKADMFMGNAEWQHQILAGIQTVAVISLPPLGVILFGSTQKICESPDFILQAQYFLRQLGIKANGHVHVDFNFTHPQATFTSVISSLESSGFKNNISWNDSVCEQRMYNHLSSESSSLASGLLSLGYHNGTTSQTSSLNSHISSVPVGCTSSGFFNGPCNIFQGTPSISSYSVYQPINQQSALTDARILLPPRNGVLHSSFKSNTWGKENDSLPHMEHKLFPGMVMPGVFSMVPTNSHSSIPHSNAFHFLGGNSALSHNRDGPRIIVDKGSISSSNSEPNLIGAGKLLELLHCFSPPVSIPTDKSSSKASSMAAELPSNFLASPSDINPEKFVLIHSNNELTNHHIADKSMNNHIYSCERTDDQVNTSLAASSTYNFPDSDGASSSMVENVICAATTEFPNNLSKTCDVCVDSSVDRDVNKNESTYDAPSQLVSENDLFDDMELELSPLILRQECWDEITLPAVRNSCIELSANLQDRVSELEMDSVFGAGKELFSDPNLEQLLDAVVAGNANLSSNSNSDASQDSRHQLPTTTKLSDPQVKNPSVIDLPSLIHAPALSLPECNIENMMQGSPRDVLKNPHVQTWIDDSCSVNVKGSALNQSKKPEESAKVVRKRARPGESTRPRPKDRQQIQDRVKELREIVPNGAKCSIDALLERTIKHMLFLQSVTKYADKLRQADEPKMIGEESGVVLKDNTNGGVGGATWAYEVAGQTMVCPILVEDVHPSGQMLVEMLCEERGFFLEIADVVRGFGLTILKGAMEIRSRKVWARFLVEANKDVTRMDIFLSLVQLLQQTSSMRSSEPQAKAIDTAIAPLTAYQSPPPIPIGLADRLQ